MKQRLIAGIFAAAVLVAGIIYLPIVWLLVVVLALGILAYMEFDRMLFCDKNLVRQIRVAGFVGVSITLMAMEVRLAWVCLWMAFGVFAITHFIQANKGVDYGQSVSNLALEWLGLSYIVSLFGFLVPILNLGRNYLLLLFVIVFVGDTAAYLVGTRVGKTTLAQRVSPKKTVEGFVSALLFAELSCFLWLYFFHPDSWSTGEGMRLLIWTPVISILAQVGDLFESLLKRSQAMKDSGAFLPGHGGLLDRIDGLVFAAPVFYILLTLGAGR